MLVDPRSVSSRLAMVSCAVVALFPTGCGGGGGGGEQDSDAGDEPGDLSTDDTAFDQDDDGGADPSDGDGQETPIGCTEDSDCDDSDPCTSDDCDELDEVCVNDALDSDGDGYPASRGPAGEDCGGTDCDDAVGTTYPGAAEDACDLVDSDCDDSISEFIDDDGDGWIDEDCPAFTETPTGYDGLDDCDDTAAGSYPGASEGCDGSIDNDCDGDSTEVDSDADGDGVSPASCGGADCDDTDPLAYPGATEICDDVDQDCDSDLLDAPGADDDSDGVLDEGCEGTDCDDTSAAIHPGATEACDTVDQDCDGSWADGGADDDLDGHLDSTCGGDDCNDLDLTTHTGAAEGGCDIIDNDCDGDAVDGPMDSDDDDFVDPSCTDGDDCDDDDPLVHPGAAEQCDTIDNDCDWSWADGGADDDSDGHLDSTCGGDDCNDAAPAVYTGAPEDGCDAVDNDCDGDAIDGIADDDGDGYMDSACPSGNDCNDLAASVYPGATEACDMVDQDCDGSWADGGADDDSDGHLDSTCGGDDCNDAAPTVYTGAPEVCWNGVDEDCDGLSASPGPRIPPVRVSDPGAGNGQQPVLIWTGSEFGASWYDGREGQPEIYFSRISSAGVVFGSNTRVSNTAGISTSPSIAWTGSEWIVAWTEQGTPTTLPLARLSAFGAKIGSDTIISNPSYEAGSISLAWSGSETGMVWDDRRDGGSANHLFFNRLSISGAKAGSDTRVETTTGISWEPWLVWTGSEYALSFTDTRSANQEIYFARVSAAGSKVGADVRVTSSAGTSNTSMLAWSGTGFAITWTDARDGNDEMYFSLLSSTGVETLPDARLTNTTEVSWFPAVEWAGGSWAISWLEYATPRGVYFNYLSQSDGSRLGSDIDVNGSTCTNGGASEIASTSSEIGVLWADSCSSTGATYFTLIPRCD